MKITMLVLVLRRECSVMVSRADMFWSVDFGKFGFCGGGYSCQRTLSNLPYLRRKPVSRTCAIKDECQLITASSVRSKGVNAGA